VAIQLPASWRYRLMRWGWPPQNRLARWGVTLLKYALAFFVLQVVILVLRLPGSGIVEACVISAAAVALILFGIAGFGWIRQKLLWRLRNRLIVTYVFIGVIPALLLVAMTSIAFYLFAGQFANFVVTSDINTELKTLETTNITVCHSLANRLRKSDTSTFTLLDDLRSSNRPSTPAEVCAWYKEKPLAVTAAPAACSTQVPDFLPARFRELVADHGTLHLRTGTTLEVAGGKLRVIATEPLDQALLDRVSGGLGKITLYALTRGPAPNAAAANVAKTSASAPGQTAQRVPANAISAGTAPEPQGSSANDDHNYVVADDFRPLLAAGNLPEASNRLDNEINFGSPLSVLNWQDGTREYRALMRVQTRPSLLYGRLFAALGEFATLAEGALLSILVLFTLIVLVALYVGSRLTRTMTLSVANLYTATQHLNRGEFNYRIEVRERDQLAALQTSFNSMASSLEKLMVEQRDKQRLENELTIAHEVQAQLFPRQISALESLEVHGFCKPARTVSGDYYDFLPATANRLGLAVGDVSGKGISAALLMATIHSAVRAYLLESVPTRVPAMAGGGGGNGFPHGPGISPSTLMYLLNRQLYSTTPQEKYATLFLGLYDGSTRHFTYTNAGHLPPILVGEGGKIRRLETGGTVVGLFDHMQYEESTVSLSAGEIFLAYSDGITEPENDYGEFGEDRLIDLVRSNRHLPLERISELVTNAVYEWIGANEQPDDVTLVLARAR
jgi:sigma-B regulation protein RsbU (phosphoserine phosphatase)